jgi:hypothetical protein
VSAAEWPCEALAAVEQQRADGLGRRCGEIAADPGHGMRGSLRFYQESYREAARTAALNCEQPGGVR